MKNPLTTHKITIRIHNINVQIALVEVVEEEVVEEERLVEGGGRGFQAR